MKIFITPQKKQRFTTVGHWEGDTIDKVTFWASDMSDWRFMVAVLFHELIEWSWCVSHGITTDHCDAFDELFEEEYKAGRSKEDEAGYDKRCPYRKGHVWGGRFERVVIWILGARWKDYVNECNNLMIIGGGDG